MRTEDMVRELRNLEEKHKNDKVDTFATNWSMVCKDVADRLEELSSKVENQENNNINASVFTNGRVIIDLYTAGAKDYETMFKKLGNPTHELLVGNKDYQDSNIVLNIDCKANDGGSQVYLGIGFDELSNESKAKVLEVIQALVTNTEKVSENR